MSNSNLGNFIFGQNFSVMKLPEIRANSGVESRFVIGDKQLLFETWKNNALQKRNTIITNSEVALINLSEMQFFLDTAIGSVGFHWIFGANKEFGYALNISVANGGMQFYYLMNGQWIPSWTK